MKRTCSFQVDTESQFESFESIWIKIKIHRNKLFQKISTIFHFLRENFSNHPNPFLLEIHPNSIFHFRSSTFNLDLAHLTKITCTHHLSRSNSSSIRDCIILTRVSARVPRWTCSIIPLALKFIQYGRTVSLDTSLLPLLLKTLASCISSPSSFVAMRCMTSRTFYAFLLKRRRPRVKGEVASEPRKAFQKKGLLQRSTTATTTANDRRRPIEISRGRGAGTPVSPPRSINLN